MLLRPEFFENRMSKAIGVDVKVVKPVITYTPLHANEVNSMHGNEAGEKRDHGEGVRSGYNVGTRSNGVDQPRWPEDLMMEIVA